MRYFYIYQKYKDESIQLRLAEQHTTIYSRYKTICVVGIASIFTQCSRAPLHSESKELIVKFSLYLQLFRY